MTTLFKLDYSVAQYQIYYSMTLSNKEVFKVFIGLVSLKGEWDVIFCFQLKYFVTRVRSVEQTRKIKRVFLQKNI